MIRIIETKDKIKVYNDGTLLEEFDSLRFDVSVNSYGFIYIHDRKSSERVFITGKENAYYLCMREVTQ